MEREQDHEQYLRDVREVLAAGDVRPHIKELVISLVTWVPDRVVEEWQALGALGNAAGNPLAERALSLAARAPAFSNLLLAKSIVSGYLSGPSTADLGAGLCRLLVGAHSDEVAELLLPWVGRPGWAGRLVGVLNVAPLHASERVVDLMEICAVGPDAHNSGIVRHTPADPARQSSGAPVKRGRDLDDRRLLTCPLAVVRIWLDTAITVTKCDLVRS